MADHAARSRDARVSQDSSLDGSSLSTNPDSEPADAYPFSDAVVGIDSIADAFPAIDTGQDAAPLVELVVTKSGRGSGKIQSYPAGLSCGSTCSAAFPMGTDVRLSASADDGSEFAGWTGDCQGKDTCIVSLEGRVAVDGQFGVEDPDGTWIKHVGGKYYERVRSLDVDAKGNVIIVGTIGANLDFGGGEIESLGSWNGFVVKYASDGSFRWVKRIGALSRTLTDYSDATQVAVDGQGNVIVMGWFVGTIDLDGVSLTGPGRDIYGRDNRSVFIAKYSQDGDLKWAMRYGNEPTTEFRAYGDVTGLAVDNSGNISWIGAFCDPVDVGGGTVDARPCPYVTWVLVRLDLDGVYQWSKSSEDYFLDVAADNQGNTLATLESTGYSPILVRYSADGAVVGSIDARGTYPRVAAQNVAVDKNGNIAVVGNASGVFDLGCGPIGSSTSVWTFAAYFSNTGYCLASGVVLDSAGGWGPQFAEIALDQDNLWLIGSGFIASYRASSGHIGPRVLRFKETLGGAYGTSIAISPSGYPVLAMMFETLERDVTLSGQTFHSAGETDILIQKRAP